PLHGNYSMRRLAVLGRPEPWSRPPVGHETRSSTIVPIAESKHSGTRAVTVRSKDKLPDSRAQRLNGGKKMSRSGRGFRVDEDVTARRSVWSTPTDAWPRRTLVILITLVGTAVFPVSAATAGAGGTDPYGQDPTPLL